MLPIASVDSRTYSALRAWYAVHDIDVKGKGNVWDLRSGAANRWPDDLKTRIYFRHIHYTLYFRRGDEISSGEALEIFARTGSAPPPPDLWHILWEPGTFPEDPNPEFEVNWEPRYRAIILQAPDEEEARRRGDRFMEENPPPPEMLPNPENWTADRARKEFEATIPRALEFWSSDRTPVNWRPEIYTIDPETGKIDRM